MLGFADTSTGVRICHKKRSSPVIGTY